MPDKGEEGICREKADRKDLLPDVGGGHVEADFHVMETVEIDNTGHAPYLLKTHPCRITSLFLGSLVLSTACSISQLASATRLHNIEMSIFIAEK